MHEAYAYDRLGFIHHSQCMCYGDVQLKIVRMLWGEIGVGRGGGRGRKWTAESRKEEDPKLSLAQQATNFWHFV